MFTFSFLIFAGFFFYFQPLNAIAAGCGWNADRTVYNCDGGHSGAAVGASAPLVGDSIGANPAALPSAPSPFGIEGIYSDRSAPKGKNKISVSTVKGFDGIGFGIGSWADETFGAPDFPNHFLGSNSYAEYQQYRLNPPSTIGIRPGMAVVLPKGPLPKGIRISVGGSLGLGRVKGATSPQVGAMMKLFGLGLGYSYSYEQISRTLPKIRVSTFSAGMQISSFYLGYSRIFLRSSANKTFADVYGLRFSRPKWEAHGELKVQKDHRNMPDHWYRAGILRRLGSSLGIGYEYGIYRHSHSGVLQIYL